MPQYFHGRNEPGREYLNLKSSDTNKIGTIGPYGTRKMCALLNNNVQLNLKQTNQNLITTYNSSKEK